MRKPTTRFITPLLAMAGALALGSCGSQGPEEGTGDDPAPAPVETAAPVDTAAAESGTIPAEFRGNWGINAADCEGGAAAKGLLEIDGTTLTFYESVGTLGDEVTLEPHAIQAVFAFEGEGMEWTREMRMETRDDGQTLIRQEMGEDAMQGALEYRKCG